MSVTDLVQAVDGRPCTTSLQVAEKFGKRHYDVLRAIGVVEKGDSDFGHRNFALSSYTSSQNKQIPMYHMTKDGFVLLVMGFTGRDAHKFKIEYIEAFNQMEQQLRQTPATAALQMAKILDEQTRRIELLEAGATTRPSWFSIAGYARLKGRQVGIRQAAALGRRAATLCRKRGITIETVEDARYGKVNVYPAEVLDVVFE